MVLQSVLTRPKSMDYKKVKDTFETCIAQTEKFILIGTTTGVLNCYDRVSEKFLFTYTESGKDYLNNAITCIDVHPKRPEMVVLGF